MKYIIEDIDNLNPYIIFVMTQESKISSNKSFQNCLKIELEKIQL